MKDRFRKDGAPSLPGDNPSQETDKIILAVHFVFVSAAILLWYFLDLSAANMGAGFILGVSLYSLYWRWRYGFWPD